MKKLLSVLLAFSVILGMTIGVSADTLSTSIKKINEAGFQSALSSASSAGKIVLNDNTRLSVKDLADLDVNPGDVIKIYMTGGMFANSNDNPLGDVNTEVPYSYLSRADITARTSTTQGAGAVEVTLEGNKTRSYLKIAFSKSPAYNGEKFSYSVFLAKNGSRKSTTRISVRGMIESDLVEIDQYDDYYDISDGTAVKATTNIKNFELILGDDCSIIRNLTRGKTYSGIALNEILAKDEPLFSKYFYLEHIYRLETVGLKTTGNVVFFDLGERYYAYNTNGDYIGTTDKGLPYWTKYYLSTRKYDRIDVIK